MEVRESNPGTLSYKKSDRECRLAERRQARRLASTYFNRKAILYYEAMKLIMVCFNSCWILVSSAPHSFYSFGCETWLWQ